MGIDFKGMFFPTVRIIHLLCSLSLTVKTKINRLTAKNFSDFKIMFDFFKYLFYTNISLRVLLSGRVPASQAGCVGSIPIIRLRYELHFW